MAEQHPHLVVSFVLGMVACRTGVYCLVRGPGNPHAEGCISVFWSVSAILWIPRNLHFHFLDDCHIFSFRNKTTNHLYSQFILFQLLV